MDRHDGELERVRAIYDRRGESITPRDGGLMVGDARHWLATRARGDTLEVGIGRGFTIPHYGPDVRLTGIDLSSVMLASARARAEALDRSVTLRQGNAMALEAPDASFDTVVFSMVLCSVPDERLAIAEAARVLRPGGRLLAVEHVRSPNLGGPPARARVRAVRRPTVRRSPAPGSARPPRGHGLRGRVRRAQPARHHGAPGRGAVRLSGLTAPDEPRSSRPADGDDLQADPPLATPKRQLA